jgi:hypothetical protein
MKITLFFLILVGGFTGACHNAFQHGSISESHIRGNVPDEKNFDKVLNRDLAAYFHEYIGKAITVEHELLRKEPTQAGVAFPKFYVWVKIYEKERLVEEGAARLAAVEKNHFDIIQYLSRDEIKLDSEKVYKIFPKTIADKIQEKANNPS